MYKQIDSNRRKSWFLIFLFVGVLAAVGYVYGAISGYGYGGLVFALMVSVGMTLFSWFAGDKVVLATSGAKEITTRDQFPYLWNLVENVAITAGIPRPRIYVIQDSAPNAFATGRDQDHASVAFTTGIIELLENEELEGVIAHELSHIKNQDTKVMMLVAVLVGAIVLLGDFFFHFGFGGRGRNRSSNPLLLIIGIVLLILSPIAGKLIQLAISRKREFLADASGALLTRYPEGLAQALEKIGRSNKPMQRASQATAHLWIASPFGSSNSFRSKVSALFSTHPPIEERVHQLRLMGDAR
ncbi:zinc metalloprotease HtpX [Candidatus Uhrbacteria bacterium CG22_combo_CG10-13_8_21_14_all_47_17]|uniref:Protease HtpX homolog n=1 Tax=Candidatus Uhrbacteria bacterium CG22_combo_CG10-13_8_21_14_all_47_17 TaxID=1975041 RepID=A0A2H0BU94_9BACT|nr:MAG: zinc metalloprotease HtpX [Candidatus Uhrbacteria bacterium CG22_combo_CG10-13_8_21_14_all_47_17]